MKLIFFICALLFQFQAFSQTAVAEIAVGEASVDKDKFVIDDAELKSLGGQQKSLASELIDILRNDFVFYKHKHKSPGFVLAV